MTLLSLVPILIIGASVMTYAGLAIKTNLISGLGGTIPKYLAWGTGAGTSAQTDTTLFAETTYAGYARVAATPTRTTTAETDDTISWVGTLTNSSGAALAVTNAGTFDASTAGNLFIKGDFATVNLNANDSIQFTITEQEQ